MTVVAEAPATLIDEVAAAAARGFTRRGETIVQMPLRQLAGNGRPTDPTISDSIRAIVVPGLKRVECCVEEADALGPLAAVMASLSKEGWDVHVLAPGAVIGAAHSILRGMDLSLQQWWSEPDGIISFGRPEVP